jgi:site-specific recombinase XerD
MKHQILKAPPLEGVGEAFEKYLQQKNITPHTIRRHQREVKRFTQWLKQKYGVDAAFASQKMLLEYLQFVKKQRKLCNATQNHILQMLKNYFGFLSKQTGIANITAFIKIRGINRKHIHQFFTPDELDNLCDAYYHFARNYLPSKKELRHCNGYEKLLQGRYIAVTLIAYQALQIQEIENLQYSDFDLRKGTVCIHAHRRGAERKLTLEPLQIGVLMQFYNNEDVPLIPNRNHFEDLSIALKKLAVKYKDFRQLRASTITHWLKLHGLRKAQYLAGHKNIQSTEKFLAGEFETLQNEFEKFHPLN